MKDLKASLDTLMSEREGTHMRETFDTPSYT